MKKLFPSLLVLLLALCFAGCTPVPESAPQATASQEQSALPEPSQVKTPEPTPAATPTPDPTPTPEPTKMSLPDGYRTLTAENASLYYPDFCETKEYDTGTVLYLDDEDGNYAGRVGLFYEHREEGFPAEALEDPLFQEDTINNVSSSIDDFALFGYSVEEIAGQTALHLIYSGAFDGNQLACDYYCFTDGKGYLYELNFDTHDGFDGFLRPYFDTMEESLSIN